MPPGQSGGPGPSLKIPVRHAARKPRPTARAVPRLRPTPDCDALHPPRPDPRPHGPVWRSTPLVPNGSSVATAWPPGAPAQTAAPAWQDGSGPARPRGRQNAHLLPAKWTSPHQCVATVGSSLCLHLQNVALCVAARPVHSSQQGQPASCFLSVLIAYDARLARVRVRPARPAHRIHKGIRGPAGPRTTRRSRAASASRSASRGTCVPAARF